MEILLHIKKKSLLRFTFSLHQGLGLGFRASGLGFRGVEKSVKMVEKKNTMVKKINCCHCQKSTVYQNHFDFQS